MRVWDSPEDDEEDEEDMNMSRSSRTAGAGFGFGCTGCIQESRPMILLCWIISVRRHDAGCRRRQAGPGCRVVSVRLNALAQILSRRKKNNPVLIGEPGVGKSAIVEGLALRIVQKKVSAYLV